MPQVSLKYTDQVALVDDSDFALISQHEWRRDALGYAVARIGRALVSMHRLITGAESGQVVDHANHNTLDNRRSNLRVCTHAENMRNRKMAVTNKCGVKGVYWCASRRKFRAEIKAHGKKHFLGDFNDINEAGKAYAAAANRLHGEFANY